MWLRLERLIDAALVAGILIAAGASAEELRHLDGLAAVSAADAKARCVAALVKSGEACDVGGFGQVGAVAVTISRGPITTSSRRRAIRFTRFPGRA